MTIKELIEKLKDSEARYGPDTEVILLDYEQGRFVRVPVSDVIEISDISGQYHDVYTGLSSLPTVLIS